MMWVVKRRHARSEEKGNGIHLRYNSAKVYLVLFNDNKVYFGSCKTMKLFSFYCLMTLKQLAVINNERLSMRGSCKTHVLLNICSRFF